MSAGGLLTYLGLVIYVKKIKKKKQKTHGQANLYL